jgi:hypothetical protein
VLQQLVQARGLTPLRILIRGPPAAGERACLAKVLAEQVILAAGKQHLTIPQQQLACYYNACSTVCLADQAYHHLQLSP